MNQLTWTTDKPTMPGWYWGAFDVDTWHYMVLIAGSLPFFEIMAVFEGANVVTKDVNAPKFKFWAGPIPEPGETL